MKFSVYAHQLNSSLDILKRGLDAAERSLSEETPQTIEAGEELDRKIERGEEAGYQLDDEGDLVYDPHEGIHYEHMAIDETTQQVRKAMLVALYGVWEHVVRDMTQKHGTRDNHQVLEVALLKHDVEITPGLRQLRLLVNLVKHNSKSKMLKLWEERSDLFYNGFDPDVHFPNDWVNTLTITSDHINEFFEAARASGPKH